jgi:hypothetical protein
LPIAVTSSVLALALAGCADAEPSSALSPLPDAGPVPDVPWSATPNDAEPIAPDVGLRPPGDASPPAPDMGADAAFSVVPDVAVTTDVAVTPDAAAPTDAAVPPEPDAAVPPDPDAAVPPDPEPVCSSPEGECDRTLYDSARNYAAANPQRDGATWHLWCGSLMWRFGGLAEANARPSAIEAYRDSDIRGATAADAPQGALHWWDIGEDGHVGLDVQGRGHTIFMATRHLREVWGDALGVNGEASYSAETGARYLGWSLDYAGGRFPSAGLPACDPPPALPAACDVAASRTAQTGETDLDFWRHMQRFAGAHAYDGPVNGLMDRPSWAGVQRGLRMAGYEGPDDGLPGVNTFSAMQRVAARYGYMGPVDGVLGPNSYRGFAAFLNAEY